MKKRFFLILAVISVNTFAERRSCMNIYSEYADAQVLWQNQSAALVVETLPQHKVLVDYYRDVQIAAIRRRGLAVQLALQHFADKINTEAGLNQWIDYSPELEAALSKKSPGFKLAVKKYEEMKNRHPGESGDQFRKAFRDTVTQTKEFQNLMSAFNQKVSELNAVRCKKP
jgi:hypothetical protein